MKYTVVLTMTTAMLLQAGMAAAEQDLMRSLADGEAELSFRYRLEGVEQDALPEDSLASTLRTRLGYRTAPWRGWTGLVEFDNVSYLLDDDFNNLRNGKPQYPVIADPDGTGVNQFNVTHAGEKHTVVIGRQRINLDNQRFIGGVGWRQNEQTYDALALSIKPGAGSYSWHYLDRVQRIFGPDAGTPPATLDSRSHLLHGEIEAKGLGTFSPYGYWLEFDEAPALSSRTIGLRFSTVFKSGDLEVPLTLEYARQHDNGNNPVDYSANYWLAEVGVGGAMGKIHVGMERLGADEGAGRAFTTPLATLHKFNGWADIFLSTPAGGLDDWYVSGSVPLMGGSLSAAWHRFDAESGDLDYGKEIDVSWARGLNERVSLLLKAARYDADDFATDTTKAWLMVTVTL